jgi:hypothetical protein
MTTYADNAPALGMSRNPERQDAPVTPLDHHFVLATDLEPGDRIRDRGELRIIARVDPQQALRGLLMVHFDDGSHLGIPAHQHVTVWR